MIYDLADQLGTVVCEEVPCIKNRPFSPRIQEQMVREMIRRDRNHPSVFYWSVGNETKNAADSAWAVAEDPTRPIACRSTEGAAARALTFSTASRGAEPLSLAGRWRFQLDREDNGIGS